MRGHRDTDNASARPRRYLAKVAVSFVAGFAISWGVLYSTMYLLDVLSTGWLRSIAVPFTLTGLCGVVGGVLIYRRTRLTALAAAFACGGLFMTIGVLAFVYTFALRFGDEIEDLPTVTLTADLPIDGSNPAELAHYATSIFYAQATEIEYTKLDGLPGRRVTAKITGVVKGPYHVGDDVTVNLLGGLDESNNTYAIVEGQSPFEVARTDEVGDRPILLALTGPANDLRVVPRYGVQHCDADEATKDFCDKVVDAAR